MPASAPALASNPAQKAPPMNALITGIIGNRKPIAIQTRQVRISKTALAATLTAPLVAAAVRRHAYQSSANAAIAAAIRIDGLLFSRSAEHVAVRLRPAQPRA